MLHSNPRRFPEGDGNGKRKCTGAGDERVGAFGPSLGGDALGWRARSVLSHVRAGSRRFRAALDGLLGRLVGAVQGIMGQPWRLSKCGSRLSEAVSARSAGAQALESGTGVPESRPW